MMCAYIKFCCLLWVLKCSHALLLENGPSSIDAQVLHLRAELAALKETVNALTENINSECTLRCPKTQSVGFMAQPSASLSNPAIGHVIIFDDVITNVGNAFNNVHGIFTAPVNGTYNFNVVASSPPSPNDHWLHLFVMKNSAKMGYVFLDSHTTYWLRRTTDVTLHLTQNDEVWVEVGDVRGDHILGGCCFHTHFSGFLIQAD